MPAETDAFGLPPPPRGAGPEEADAATADPTALRARPMAAAAATVVVVNAAMPAPMVRVLLRVWRGLVWRGVVWRTYSLCKSE